MNRYSLFLILAGLAVGLFLGFNPTAHRDVVRWWDSATAKASTSQPQAQRPTAVFSLRQFDSSVARLFRTSARPQSSTRSEPATVWSQIVAALQQLWHALQKIWLSIAAKFAGPKS